ncbi:hypothetical protein AX15_007244 [Amanita polypyramis BW_CC]|nr:hypothetical protein AX15_007244 [Amanita polypyramis BW_CC]
MLGTHTKQIHAYGKRSQRIVAASDERPSRKNIPNIFDEPDVSIQWAPVVSRMRKRENVDKPDGQAGLKSPSPRVIHVQRKKPAILPIRRKKTGRDANSNEAEAVNRRPGIAQGKKTQFRGVHLNGAEKRSRTPLVAHTLNITLFPAIPKKHKFGAPKLQWELHKPTSDVVDVDIIVLDEDGRTIAKERRVSRTNAGTNSAKLSTPPESPYIRSPNGDLSESDDEFIQPRRLQKSPKLRKVYSDDSETDEGSFTPPQKTSKPPSQQENDIVEPSKERPSHPNHIVHEKVIQTHIHSIPYKPIIPSRSEPSARFVSPRRPQSSSLYNSRRPHIPSPIARPRQLTPIRGLRTSRNAIAPPSPPTPSDFDSSIEISDLGLESSVVLNSSPYLTDPSAPDYLKSLLEECHQEECGLYEFSSFIKSFPYDPTVRSSEIDGEYGVHSFKKIGEASYSEVFGIGDVVLKIIPLRNESGLVDDKRDKNSDYETEGPATSEAKDVRREIIVTRAMGEVCDGFVKLLKAYVVRGRYPELLLRLWDEYNETKGSESVRPDTFTVSQAYAIIVLPNGGPDLEAYTFTNVGKSGWRQACSIFWQVSKALAHAEQLVSFEHRDLHWGQILVKDVPAADVLTLNNLCLNVSNRLFMDDPVHGVQATVIDLGLSRMDASDSNGFEKIYWTPFDGEIFMGEGDYQFDIYRTMRDHVGIRWESFHPLTNVMWLHYLVLKLLQSKHLKPPSHRSSQTLTTTFTEKECYNSLLEIENLLAKCVSDVHSNKKAIKKAKGRRKTQAPVCPPPGVSCAGQVIQYGVTKGWIMPIA